MKFLRLLPCLALPLIACDGSSKQGIGATPTPGNTARRDPGGPSSTGTQATPGTVKGPGAVDTALAACARPVQPSSAVPTAEVGNGTPASCTEAEFRAKAAAGGRITFRCGSQPHVITLTQTFQIETDTTLDGGGLVSLSGGNAVRVLKGKTGTTLQLQRITIRDGRASDDGGAGVMIPWRGNVVAIDTAFLSNVNTGTSSERQGGALTTHEGTAVVIGSRFEGNKGRLGAGINNLLSNLTIVDSVFLRNTTDGKDTGGALYVDGALRGGSNGFVTICGSTFQENAATQGGGIFWCGYTDAGLKSDDVLTIEKSAFAGNTAKSGAGLLSTCNGKAKVVGSAFFGNVATEMGGGICSYKDNLEIVNTTLVGNTAAATMGGGAHSNGAAILRHATIVGNESKFGGGISGEKWTVSNSIVAGNTATNPWGIQHNCSHAALAGSGFVVFPDRTGNLSDPNNRPCGASLVIGDPKADTLKANGGPTHTAALAAGSAAMSVGSNCEAKDQRGVGRKARCDAGAFETK